VATDGIYSRGDGWKKKPNGGSMSSWRDDGVALLRSFSTVSFFRVFCPVSWCEPIDDSTWYIRMDRVWFPVCQCCSWSACTAGGSRPRRLNEPYRVRC
jgi:hypothetical protein